MAKGNSYVKWSLLVETVNQIKTRYIDKTTYISDMSKKVSNDDFETLPIDWTAEIERKE